MISKTLSRFGIEVWKDIPKFEGYYQVSNLGNVRSLNYRKTKKIKNLKLRLNNRGRFAVNLNKNRVRYDNFIVYQLVAIAFLNHKPCGHKIVVDHIDNNKENDKLYNLQLISTRENCSKDKKGGSSKYVGVSWHKNLNKWRTNIYIKGKLKHLGYFTDEKKAAQAYQNELKKII
tara:strand:- start:1542 stop:2063 length:522 start_codon:yes stop_codon:yes gene_type:complete